MHAVGCAHDSGEKRNVLIVSICLLIGVGFTLRSNTHWAVKVLGMREGPVLLHVAAGPKPVVGNASRKSGSNAGEIWWCAVLGGCVCV